MAFKCIKLKKKKEREILKVQPKTKTLKVAPVYEKSMSVVDIISILLCTKKNTALRKILALDSTELFLNKSILTRKVLDLAIVINFNSALIFKVLRRMVTDETEIINEIVYEYLVVSILSNRDYKKYYEFCWKFCQNILLKNKLYLLEIIEDVEVTNQLKKIREKVPEYSFSQKFALIGQNFVSL